MIKIISILILVLFISGCSSEDIFSTCADLCNVDKEAYCVEERILTFEDGSKTIGSCRALSKFNENFIKCQGYCTEYGKGPNCRLENGIEDSNCDGK